MINSNSATYQWPVNHRTVQNYSQRGGKNKSNNFQPQHNQNNQLQQLLNLILPLLQQLISNLSNSHENNQHCNNQCDTKTPQELQLSDAELTDLNRALYPEGARESAGFPGLPDAVGVIDNDCNGKISIGDTISLPPTPFARSTTVDQGIIDRLNNQQENSPPGQGNELDLLLRQEDAIRQRFDDNSALAFDGLATQFTGRSFDDNGDEQLSAGDSIEIRRFGGNAIPQTDFVELQTLTADDITAINTIASQPILNIDNAQRVRLQDAAIGQFLGFGNGSFLNSVIDSNGDNQISVGDTLKIVTVDGAETQNSTATSSFQTLTQEQFDRFEAGIVFDQLGQQVDGTGK